MQTIKGFTLAELLIALAIIGAIATFTIPKILQANKYNQKKLVLRETIATIDHIFYEIGQATRVDASTNLNVYLQTRLNAVRYCPNNSIGEGCWTAAMADPGGLNSDDAIGAILHNGAYIAGLGSNTNDPTPLDNTRPYVSFLIDYNGPAGPNVEGEDTLFVEYCWYRQCTNLGAGYTGRGDSVHPEGDDSVALFLSVFD